MMGTGSATVGAVAIGSVGPASGSADVLIVAVCASVMPAVAGYVLDDSVSDAWPAAPLCGVGCDC